MTLTDLLAVLVRGGEVAPAAWSGLDVETVCAAAEHHGVLPLVAERLRTIDEGPSEVIVARVTELARLHAAADLAREAELRAALAALEHAGMQPLVFKGAHLAYRDYARPDLRPRLDSDVLIPADRAAREAAHRVLIGRGYTTAPHAGGDLVMTQRMYAKRQEGRLLHAIDVHWRIANPQSFSRALLHEELVRHAERLPQLGPAARGPSGPHALLIACIHRVAHHAGSDCLIWLYDIDRIARRLTPADWAVFLSLATERRVLAVCDASLGHATERFETPVRGDVRQAAQLQRGAHEQSARYLTPPGDSVAAALSDLRALSSWGDRARLAREHLLPPAAYMREVYAPGSHAPLPWLYVRRVLVGARRWMRRRKVREAGG